MVLKELDLTDFTLGEFSGLEKLILTVSTLKDVAVLKELILTVSTLGRYGSLQGTDFNSFYFARVWGS